MIDTLMASFYAAPILVGFGAFVAWRLLLRIIDGIYRHWPTRRK